MSFWEAMGALFAVQVDNWETGEPQEQRLILLDPTGIEVGHEEPHISIILARSDKERDQNISEVMKEIA